MIDKICHKHNNTTLSIRLLYKPVKHVVNLLPNKCPQAQKFAIDAM